MKRERPNTAATRRSRWRAGSTRKLFLPCYMCKRCRTSGGTRTVHRSGRRTTSIRSTCRTTRADSASCPRHDPKLNFVKTQAGLHRAHRLVRVRRKSVSDYIFYCGFSYHINQCHSVDFRQINYYVGKPASGPDLVHITTHHRAAVPGRAAGLHSHLRGADVHVAAHQARARVPRSRRRVDGVWGRR